MPVAAPRLAISSEQLPLFTVETVVIPQGDGSYMVRAGKPVLGPEYIGTAVAARLLGLSQRTIEHECDLGLFKTAFKPGGKPRSMWKIARAEVLGRKARRPG